MAYEKIVTVFDTAANANRAMDSLEKAGFSRSEMHTLTKDDATRINGEAATALKQPGFWQRLFGSDVVEYEGHVFSKAVDGGGTVLTLRADESDVPEAIKILHDSNAIDIEHRAASLGLIKPAVEPPVAAPTPAKSVAAAVAATPVAKVATDQVLRLAEEQLQVGKEQVEAGTTTVRRYVIEKPVEAQVTLHEEHADVVRRAVKDPNYVGDIDWGDSTVVVTETAERALIHKVPRIAEEVMIRRAGSDRVEQIRDTVRKQQADVSRSTPDKAKM